MRLPTVEILDTSKNGIDLQAGMGSGGSLAIMAGTAARRGWGGTVSFVALDRNVERNLPLMPEIYEAADVKRYHDRRPSTFEANRIEIEAAKRISLGNGPIFLNMMWAIQKDFKDALAGAMAGGVDGFIVGAGLPLTLPEMINDIDPNADVLLIPIVSSARALDIICQRWNGRYGQLPDAVIVEGPKAGGHLGFRKDDIEKPEFQLEILLLEVLAVARKYRVNGKAIPVIVAGGIWDRHDIIRFMNLGADGVSIGTRFAATVESGASKEFKDRIVSATTDNIIVIMGSPAGMPIRILADSPGYLKAKLQNRDLDKCEYRYMLQLNGKCPAMESVDKFCICEALWAAINIDKNRVAIYTVGANAAFVTEISTVDKVIDELTGITV